MDDLKIGNKYAIHSYKHDGTLYRAWEEAILLDIYDDYLVFGNDKTNVTEVDGRTWQTKEIATMYFFKNRWFNIIGKDKHSGIFYKCNLASSFIIEDGTIKYIDYDLDLKVFVDDTYKVVDRGEYNCNRKRMKYPAEIDTILKRELKDLIELAKKKEGAFDRENIKMYYNKYNALKESVKN